jgi:hypothetical protein
MNNRRKMSMVFSLEQGAAYLVQTKALSSRLYGLQL